MKYVIVLGDGMADRPSVKNGYKTALQSANLTGATRMATEGVMGMVQTVPQGMAPGSDVANLSVLGFDPSVYYTGRSPIEALSMGIEFGPADVAYRTNLVCIDEVDGKRVILSHSAGDVTTEEAAELITAVTSVINSSKVSLYPGVSYRHCLIVKDGDTGAELTPPHDVVGQPCDQFMPRGVNAELLTELIQKAAPVLANHPVNKARVAKGLLPANSLWFWGEGRKPSLADFRTKYGLSGAMISAVDLLKGIAVGSNMTVINVPGATGNENTDYAAKGRAAIEALETHDFVFVHVEAPDECAHVGNATAKIKAIEDIDRHILCPLLEAAKSVADGLSVMFLPDHATPVEVKTHTSESVPFVMWNSLTPSGSTPRTYTEETAQSTGLFLESGEALLKLFLSNN